MRSMRPSNRKSLKFVRNLFDAVETPACFVVFRFDGLKVKVSKT